MHGVGPRKLLILLTGLAMIVAGIVGLAWF
jgi:hypothetical protein